MHLFPRPIVTRLGLLASLTSLPLIVAQDSVSYEYETYGADDESGTPFQTYMSNTNVMPPEMQINRNGTALQDGLVFLGINGLPSSGQNWPAIFEFSGDRIGSLVWTSNYTECFDFKVQTYKGEPVLTFWSGELLNGFGHGSFYILNQSYDEIAHFQAVGFADDMADMHEFEITEEGHALVMIYHAIPWDLTSSGGVEDGWLFENTFQEINIETGELIFEWNASTHVGINESYNSLPPDVGQSEETPWDYFHINSIEKDSRGDYLVSARVMDCIYKISGEDGSIIWRLQGRKSDFEVDPAATFAFQHDARWLDEEQTRMTLFDNGPTENTDYSRGLLLDINQDDMTVTLITEFTNEARTFARFEGSLQAIDPSNETTNYMLGFGNEPFFTELDHEGNILLDVQFGRSNVVNAYRTYRQQWEGKPATKPDIHWDQDSNTAYFSWNGATEVENWVVCTANTSNSPTWTNVTAARRASFETTIDLSDARLEGFVRGKAVSRNGSALEWTRASDGNELFDAPDGVEESGSVTTPTPTPSPMSSSQPTSTQDEPSSSTSDGAAAGTRATLGVMEQVYIVGVAVVGGLTFA
ncbi:family transcriptional regulator [Stemphylium lycopersici]|nr:family transcriptional regulator [Stemphylium lycopersici]